MIILIISKFDYIHCIPINIIMVLIITIFSATPL